MKTKTMTRERAIAIFILTFIWTFIIVMFITTAGWCFRLDENIGRSFKDVQYIGGEQGTCWLISFANMMGFSANLSDEKTQEVYNSLLVEYGRLSAGGTIWKAFSDMMMRFSCEGTEQEKCFKRFNNYHYLDKARVPLKDLPQAALGALISYNIVSIGLLEDPYNKRSMGHTFTLYGIKKVGKLWELEGVNANITSGKEMEKYTMKYNSRVKAWEIIDSPWKAKFLFSLETIQIDLNK